MKHFNSIVYQIRVMRVGYGQVKCCEGSLGLVPSLENIPKAENMSTHIYSLPCHQ